MTSGVYPTVQIYKDVLLVFHRNLIVLACTLVLVYAVPAPKNAALSFSPFRLVKS